MAKCKVCGKESPLISQYPGVCLECIREDFSKAEPYILKAHHKTRKEFGLPLTAPKDEEGFFCNLCINECRISEDRLSFCGLRRNSKRELKGASSLRGSLVFYFDSLPTNCVASWVCPGGSSVGFPEFSYTEGPEYGYKNLAVFYNGCSFNCLFCQNWNWREVLKRPEKEKLVPPEELARIIDEETSCICYFGGDPSCQLPHSLLASRLALKKRKGKILRICWETNGSMEGKLLEEAVKISLDSGGCIKFDLKAWTEELHIALCGVSNKRTLENFSKVSKYVKKRPSVPLLVASTLLVPGYIDEYEVRRIAEFIASLDADIPYSLLGFWPCFYMKDLPFTSYQLALRCKKVAIEAGLKNVHIGNLSLLLGSLDKEDIP